MSDLWKSLSDSLNSIFSPTTDPSPSLPSGSHAAGSPAAGGSSGESTAAAVPNERTAVKLKGYFELATEQINKAVRAEEWGLDEDAVAHYGNALSILAEAKGAWVPSTISASEKRKVDSYRTKIAHWHDNVTERLQVLGKRAAGAPTRKALPSPRKTGKNPTVSASGKILSHHQTFIRDKPVTGGPKVNSAKPKPTQVTQQSVSAQDDKLIEMINTAILDRSPAVRWDDVAGLDKAKQALMEMVILPTKRRDLFTGLRKPARGLLLFGPPGNGKTMLAKAVASESQATFFNVSASSLTSKWVGEAEKLVRTLFIVAISRQPSVIFMDEIDSVMSTRTSDEHDASRRLKSEFLIQFDGVTSNSDDLVIVIGATNKPQELDDAVLRRLVKRIYIPLPDENVRRLLLRHQLKGQEFSLPSGEVEKLVRETEGYSGSDLQALCQEAAMMPIRELGSKILNINANQVRSLRYDDFKKAMTVIRPSLQRSKWKELEQWNREFGSN